MLGSLVVRLISDTDIDWHCSGPKNAGLGSIRTRTNARDCSVRGVGMALIGLRIERPTRRTGMRFSVDAKVYDIYEPGWLQDLRDQQ